MLSNGVAPCLPYPIVKIKLQGRYAGFKTDDCIVFSEQLHTGKEAKLIAQIKRIIGITKKGEEFAKVIHSAWEDFNDEIFDADTDAIGTHNRPP